MATLTNPRLRITLVSGSDQADVEATVQIGLTKFEQNNVELGAELTLRCDLWGADSGFNGDHDHRRRLGVRRVTHSDTFTFGARVARSVLDEDRFGSDELYARFRLRSSEPSWPLDVTKDRPEISGDF